MQFVIEIDREDSARVEEEEVNNFLRLIVSKIGLEMDFWPEGEPLTTELKIQLRQFLSKDKIEVVHDGDRGYKVYLEDTLIGDWKKPKFVLKQDPSARVLSKKFYYEMQINYWTVFEDLEEEEEYE